MRTTLSLLVKRLDQLAGTSVIPWSSPVPSFGDLSQATIATLGLNPSNREFVDDTGNELDGMLRRFHTLRSLGLKNWTDATTRHLRLIVDSCRAYFFRNPYDRWFKKLDRIISGTQASYYAGSIRACHLDLIPYATACKWNDLARRERDSLLAVAGDSLGLLLRDSPVRLVVLNGSAVVDQFEQMAEIKMSKKIMPAWNLRRQTARDVTGIAYKGVINNLCGVRLTHEIGVLGFNHNIQSSFGVTRGVVAAIRDWVAEAAGEVIS